jgi:hypothetical protein
MRRVTLNWAHAAYAQALAALLVLLVALPLGAVHRVQYFCKMMGRVMDTCCCSKADAVQSVHRPAARPEIKAADCCEKLESAARHGAPAVRDGALRVLSPGYATISASVAVVAQAQPSLLLAPSVHARAPPALGPPIFLKNCSLLT